MIDPWRFGRGTTFLGLGIAGVTIGLPGRALGRVPRNQTRLWRQAVGLFLATAVLTDSGYRVMTAGVIGANNGAGMVVLLGIPRVVVGILSSWFLARRSDHRPQR